MAADLSNMAGLFKPMIEAAMRQTSGKADGKTKKKAEVKMKQKMSVKVKRG